MALLVDLIRENRCRTVVVAGLAKNTGKTVTLNRIIKESEEAGLKLLVASFGHDGESRDHLLDLEKPEIVIPPGTWFATVDKFAGAEADREKMGSLGIHTPIGEVFLFRAGSQATVVELCGLNRVSRLRALTNDSRPVYDLFLIDGAVDRRSLAVPNVADGVILATGAALGGTPREIGAVTAAAVHRLSLPVADLPDGLPSTRAGWIHRDGNFTILEGTQWVSGEIHEVVTTLRPGNTLSIPGALTNVLANRLLELPGDSRFSLVLRDGTRAHLSDRHLARLDERGIAVGVMDPVRVIAVTINPFNPWGKDHDPADLEEAVRLALPHTPVCNVRSAKYGERGMEAG